MRVVIRVEVTLNDGTEKEFMYSCEDIMQRLKADTKERVDKAYGLNNVRFITANYSSGGCSISRTIGSKPCDWR